MTRTIELKDQGYYLFTIEDEPHIGKFCQDILCFETTKNIVIQLKDAKAIEKYSNMSDDMSEFSDFSSISRFDW